MATLAQTACGLTCCDTVSVTPPPRLRCQFGRSDSECWTGMMDLVLQAGDAATSRVNVVVVVVVLSLLFKTNKNQTPAEEKVTSPSR